MEKIVIIINGQGGVGKDTLCDFAAKKFNVQNVSAITPIKEMASMCGWNGKKDAKSRAFLSELKKVVVSYNDYPTFYLLQKYDKFMQSSDEILFMHIREIEEIKKIKELIPTRCVTLLVRRDTFAHRLVWGNTSDDLVDQYQYDYYYNNIKPLDEAEADFIKELETAILPGLV